jgi:hypothetical protein
MFRIVSGKSIYFIGKLDELIEQLEELTLKYTTLQEAIDDILNS